MASKRERKLKKWKSRIERDRKLATKNHKQFDSKMNTKEIEIRIQLFNQKFRRMSKSIYSSIISRTNKLVNSLKPINKEYALIHTDKPLPSKLTKHHNTYSFVDIPNVDLDYLDTHNSDVNPINLSQLSARWEEHQIDILNEHTNWSVSELSQLHNSLMEYKEQLGLYSNSQFATNYEKAGELIDDSGTAIADLNKIIANEIDTVPNNSSTTFRLIKMEFESKVAEKFYSSDQARQMRVLHDYIHVEHGNADDEDYYNQL